MMMCCVGQMVVAQTPVSKLRINPEFARGGSFSEYFDSVDFIPLETTKESFFGDVYKLELAPGHFIISDQDTKSVLIFKEDGRFSGKIDARKFPHSTFSDATIYNDNVTYDPKDSLVMLTTSYNAGKFCWFDLNANNVRNTPFDESISVCLAWLDTNMILYTTFLFPDKKDTLKDLVAVAGSKTRYLPVNTNHLDMKFNMGGFDRPGFLYKSGDSTVLYARRRVNIIYEFGKEGLKQEYDLVFPRDYTYPANFDSLSEDRQGEYLVSHNKTFILLRSAYKMGNRLFFEALNSGGYITGNRHFMYDLKSGDLVSLDRIVSDSLSYFLPFTAPYGTIAGTDGRYIYCYVSSFDMFNAKEENKHPVKYNPALERYFQTANRKSNPVIVRLRLK